MRRVAQKKEQIRCKWQQLRYREAHKRHTTDADGVGVGELLQLRIINKSYTDRHWEGTGMRASGIEGRHHLVYTGGIRILNCGFSNEQTPLQSLKNLLRTWKARARMRFKGSRNQMEQTGSPAVRSCYQKMATHAKRDPRTNCNKSSRALSISRVRPHNRTTPFWEAPSNEKKNRATIQKWLTSQGIE